MSINNKTWVSKNGNWMININDNRLTVENIHGEIQYPIVYDNRHIGFDDILPKYINAAVKSFACGLFIWKDHGAHIVLISPGGYKYHIVDKRTDFLDYINANSGDIRGVCTAYHHILINFDAVEV